MPKHLSNQPLTEDERDAQIEAVTNITKHVLLLLSALSVVFLVPVAIEAFVSIDKIPDSPSYFNFLLNDNIVTQGLLAASVMCVFLQICTAAFSVIKKRELSRYSFTKDTDEVGIYD